MDGSGIGKQHSAWTLGDVPQNTYVFHMNGLSSTYNKYIGSVASMPNNSGFIFPFVEDLAREDDGTVPEVIAQYFMHALGESKEVASGVFESLKSGWGIIRKTKFGDQLAHIYSGIKLAIETGAQIKLIYTTQYGGFTLSGSGFSIVHRGSLRDPVSYDELQAQFENAIPGARALANILDQLTMTAAEKAAALALPPTNMHQLRALITRHGYNINNEQAIRTNAIHLQFPDQPYLVINSHNVSAVLKAISQPATNDVNFPIHPLMILSPVRNHRLWSAFGDHAPTFIIPGGRSIDLESNQFSYKEKSRSGKAKIEHTVTKMHIQIVPLQKAITDFDAMMVQKHVLSPIGTPLMKKVSSLSVFREFAGNSATEVLAALRQAAGVTVVQGTHVGMKRKADDVGGIGSKRAKVHEAMDDI